MAVSPKGLREHRGGGRSRALALRAAQLSFHSDSRPRPWKARARSRRMKKARVAAWRRRPAGAETPRGRLAMSISAPQRGATTPRPPAASRAAEAALPAAPRLSGHDRFVHHAAGADLRPGRGPGRGRGAPPRPPALRPRRPNGESRRRDPGSPPARPRSRARDDPLSTPPSSGRQQHELNQYMNSSHDPGRPRLRLDAQGVVLRLVVEGAPVARPC